MTVKELIELLKKQDQNLEVLFFAGEFNAILDTVGVHKFEEEAGGEYYETDNPKAKKYLLIGGEPNIC